MENRYLKTISILQPKTIHEIALISRSEVMEGLWWGKPRPGHAEGEVIYHVSNIFNNIDRLSIKTSEGSVCEAAAVCGSDIWKQLRKIALIHDTFKYQVDRVYPRNGENHHATRARRYLEQNHSGWYDGGMLEVLELHDEAYNSWCKGNRMGDWESAKTRGLKLIDRLGNNLRLFLMFYTCDTHTEDIERPDLVWFKSLIKDNDIEYFIQYS